MTVETFVGIIWVALVTGLVFAKAARPEASVLFSKHCVVSQYQGRSTFMFRLGNARGNSVVEASLTATALVDDVSPEGTKMRRLYDLPLVRTRQPLFALAWTVFHVIDEKSPFYGRTQGDLHEALSGIIITMVGHDETYANTVHARHHYYPEDVRYGHDFVDVTSMRDGRIVLDFRGFHLTRPSGDAALGSDS